MHFASGRIYRHATMALSVTTLLSVLGVMVFAMRQSTISPFTLGFECVVAFGAAIGVMISRGMFASGPSIGPLCVALAIGVGSLLTYQGSGQQLGGTSLKPLLALRAALAGGFMVVAGLEVLSRAPSQALPALWRGVLLGLPALAIAFVLRPGSTVLSSLEGAAAFLVTLLLGGVFLGTFAASAHYLIKAFTPQPPMDEERA